MSPDKLFRAGVLVLVGRRNLMDAPGIFHRPAHAAILLLTQVRAMAHWRCEWKLTFIDTTPLRL